MKRMGNSLNIFTCKFLVSFVIGFVIGSVLLIVKSDDNVTFFKRLPNSKSKKNSRHDAESGPSKALFIGMMSSKKYLNTRAQAVVDSWWHKTTHVDMEIFAEKPSDDFKLYQRIQRAADEPPMEMNIVSLPGVNDTSYPPQKKSFSMLAYMINMKLDEYNWFMRLDDDAYVYLAKLMKFLNALDSSQKLFIGSPGFGRHAEDFVDDIGSYCMGGPGIIFSRGLLMEMRGQLNKCMDDLYTTHEDIELGRCINRVANISCTNSFEANNLFFQNYEGVGQYGGDIKDLGQYKREKAMTFHANKKPVSQFRLHKDLLKDEVKHLMKKISILQDDLKKMDKDAGHEENDGDEDQTDDGQMVWAYLNKHRFYSISHKYPQSLNGAKDLIQSTLKRDIFKMGRYETYIRSIPGRFQICFVKYILKQGRKVKSASVAKSFTAGVFFKEENLLVVKRLALPTRLHFITSYNGAPSDLVRFLRMYERHVLKVHSNTSLLITCCPSDNFADSLTLTLNLVNHLKESYSDTSINVLPITGGIPKASMQEIAANDPAIHEEDILFFCEMNTMFDESLVLKIRSNTQFHQAYFPVGYSQYKLGRNEFLERQRFDVHSGFWKNFEYEMKAIYKIDFDKYDNSNTFVKDDGYLTRQLLANGIKLFRSNDDSIVHVYHDKTCPTSLDHNQLKSCIKSRGYQFGSTHFLSKLWHLRARDI